jgi:putative PIN family toxin of toxin-antitoxin system
MRIILDTNIIVSGLISEHGAPAQLLNSWTDKAFTLVTSATQIAEFQSVTHRPSVRPLITPAHAGRFINDLHRFATVLARLPTVDRSRDPNDNYLLAMAEAGAVDYLVTGDRRDVLALKRHGNTTIITAKEILPFLGFPTPPASTARAQSRQRSSPRSRRESKK